MAKKISRAVLKKLSRQVNIKNIAVDVLEEFCEKNGHLSPEILTEEIWKNFGMFSKFKKPKVVTFFTTKGGVLKTTLAYNFARIAALSGVNTLVIGLDMQCDITNCISGPVDDDNESLLSALEKLENKKTLYNFYNRQASLKEIIQPSDLENLSYISESPDLTLLNDSISLLNRREFWLKDKIVNNLLGIFDLIIFDCSPNWNRLTTNALCSTDLLISPVECKINNFKNIEVFNELLHQLKQDLFLRFSTAYVPTRFCQNKKLSCEILEWYQTNLEGCVNGYIRESIESEEAIALQKSVVEYQPASKISGDILNVTSQLAKMIENITETSNRITQTNMFFEHFLPREQMQRTNKHGLIS